ncbi:hypothetical protein [Streptomyces sp. NBC_01022]|uniref:hypothetical protein n=1 Tax=Streptomyces sp. NBC_01022 TaxID=2903723 RepID=UPI002DD84730|nr:hypothetical protein [Streptomyces sp. NBC_01022]WRZ84188.1 hypothetical protein OG316_29965 [Streptomyces sp. NBC_01022]
MKRTRAFTCAAAVLVAGLLAGASGCSSTPEDTGAKPKPTGSPTAAQTGAEQVSAPEERACKGGTYTWFNLRKVSVLNGVTKAQRVTPEGTELTAPMQRLRTDQASLETEGPRLDSHAVFFALSMRLGFAEKGDELDDPASWSGLGEPGAYVPLGESGGEFSGLGADLVSYSFAKLVEADFRYSCGSGGDREPTIGHVSTWIVTGEGALACKEPLPKDAAAAHEAKRLSCGR